MSTFEQYITNQLETNMHEELSMKIGDLVTNSDINLEELCEHSTSSLQHLYRFMVENSLLELKEVDNLLISFRFLKCGHEYPLPWLGLRDTVGEMIEKKKIVVSCPHCEKDDVVSSRAEKEKPMTLKKSDLENADRLFFMFLVPLSEQKLKKATQNQAERLGKRCEMRLQAYQRACAVGDVFQAKNAGLALKNGLNFMREKLGVSCAVKLNN